MKTTKLLLLFLCALPALVFAQQSKTVPASELGLLRGPYLQVATPTSMTIRWRTSVYDRSRVHYGLNKQNLDMQVSDSTLVSEHIVKISGLKPYTKYYYSIGNLTNTIEGDENNYFYTLPEVGSQPLIRVAGFGDCGNNSINQRNVRDQIVKYLGDNYLNAWILMGDNAYTNGSDAEFQAKFFNNYEDYLLKKYPLFPVPGNHDYNDAKWSATTDRLRIAYYQNFSMPTEGEAGGVPSHTKSYYSYDIGNIHFLALDSYGPDTKG
ncbi:MAG: metallophosphoesterase family protein, partial [Mucilaginibacter sp.]|uniref:metallophosphoesterase family protein n=1 Tax=Mucilaginibacter sp. TaxID=1882438 RepID=UPI0031B33CA1